MNTENELPKSEEERETKGHFETMKEAFYSGSQDGVKKARETAPKMKSAFSEVVHDIAYGVAYGSHFAGAFAEECVPKSILDAFSKGAAAGRAKSDEVRQKAARVISPNLPASKTIILE